MAGRARSLKMMCLVAAFACFAQACGPSSTLPRRRVVESDIGSWWFRRYQDVRDIEVAVPNNPAVAHTAVYAREEAVKRASVRESDVAVAFVTEYRSSHGVADALAGAANALANEEGYVVKKDSVGGVRAYLVSSGDEAWAFWSSGRFLIKVGGRGVHNVPSAIVSRYAAIYP